MKKKVPLVSIDASSKDLREVVFAAPAAWTRPQRQRKFDDEQTLALPAPLPQPRPPPLATLSS